jgi:hypothetical protein
LALVRFVLADANNLLAHNNKTSRSNLS